MLFDFLMKLLILVIMCALVALISSGALYLFDQTSFNASYVEICEVLK